MFNQVKLSKEFPKTAHYDLGDGAYARVVMEVQQRKPDRIEIEAQAFQIDSKGNLVAGPNGIASRTAGTHHVISTSGIPAGTHVLKPGWVKVQGDYRDEDVADDIPRAKGKPKKDGKIGDVVYDQEAGIQYRFDMGEVERIRQGKCDEMKSILAQSDELIALDF